MHFVLLLHGGLPAIQRAHGICRRSDDLSGAALQHSPHWGSPETRTAGNAHGRWGNTRMRLRAELRRGLPQGNSADDVNCRSWRGGHEAGDRRFVSALKKAISIQPAHETTDLDLEMRRRFHASIPIPQCCMLSLTFFVT